MLSMPSDVRQLITLLPGASHKPQEFIKPRATPGGNLEGITCSVFIIGENEDAVKCGLCFG